MRVLGLVPARSGSKGIPGKNIRPLGNRPLLAYTAQPALASRLTRVVLSTDDEAIAEVGRRCGLDVPFLRPAHLARDETPMVPVVQHAVEWLERQGEPFDAVCLLQPTYPFRRAEDIDACVGLYEGEACDSVVSVLPVPPRYNPHWTFFRSKDGFLRLSTGDAVPIPRRQELPPAYHRDGAIYVTGREGIRQGTLLGARVIGYVTDPRRFVNLDEPDDWAVAEAIVRSGWTDSWTAWR